MRFQLQRIRICEVRHWHFWLTVMAMWLDPMKINYRQCMDQVWKKSECCVCFYLFHHPQIQLLVEVWKVEKQYTDWVLSSLDNIVFWADQVVYTVCIPFAPFFLYACFFMLDFFVVQICIS